MARAMVRRSTSSSVRIPSSGRGGGERRRAMRHELLGEVFHAYMRQARERHGAIHAVLELANVPRPVVAEKRRRHVRGEVHLAASRLRRELLEEVRCESQHVAVPLAQRPEPESSRR